MRHRSQHGDICSGLERQVMRRLDMRRTNEIDPARIDHDQSCTLAQPPLESRCKDGVCVGRVRPDHQHDIGMLDAIEILRAGARPEGCLQPVAGRRVAHTGAGIDVVAAKDGADHLLDEEGLLIGAAAGRDAA
jgi:hypothetical protein